MAGEEERPLFSYSMLHLESLPLYQAAVRIYADHPPARCLCAPLYYELATMLLRRGEAVDAARCLQAALQQAREAGRGPGPVLSEASAELLVATSLHQLELAQAAAALHQLVALLAASARPGAPTRLTSAQITLFLLLVQQVRASEPAICSGSPVLSSSATFLPPRKSTRP